MHARTSVAAFVGLALIVSLGACGKKQTLTPEQQKRKNPPSVPTNETGEVQAIREKMPVIEYHPSFLAALRSRNFYDPDNCIRWMKLTRDGRELGQYLELAAVPCPGIDDLVEESDVLLRLKVRQHPQYFTQYRIVHEQSYSPEIGVFRRIVNNGAVHYYLEGLCDIDVGGYHEGWDMFCRIAIENSLFRVPDPLDFFNLD